MSRRYPVHPRVGVGVVLLHQGQVLLVRRGNPPAQGEWSLPGGAQELGETLDATARRELREETGLDAGPLSLVTVKDAIHRDAAGAVEYHYTIVELTGAPDGSHDAHPGGDATAVRWVPVDGLVTEGVAPAIVSVVAQAAHPSLDLSG